MVLELHVFGPAFGLPSIDPECLAAILYLSKTLTAETDVERQRRAQEDDHDAQVQEQKLDDESKRRRKWKWRMVACDSLRGNPFRQLPALRIPEKSLWVAGYTEIVSYLRDASYGDIDLDSGLSSIQRADAEAFTSFVRSRGGPLLDLSFYVSSENYNNCTRSALGEVLSWPESWTLPHELREQARKRSEHLGLSALDIDVVRQQQEKEESQGLAAHIPKSLRRPKQTVSGLLGKSAQHTQFRIDAVTEDLMQPLQDQLGDGDSLLGNSLHAVDCLVIAYIALMGLPAMPQDWLKRALDTRYVTLGRWARKYAAEVFGPPVSASEATCATATSSHLPWTRASKRTRTETGLAVLECVVGVIPGLKTGCHHKEVGAAPRNATRQPHDRQDAYTLMRKRERLYSQAVTSVLATTSLVAWLVYAGILGFPHQRTSSSRRTFGEAGVLLGLR